MNLETTLLGSLPLCLLLGCVGTTPSTVSGSVDAIRCELVGDASSAQIRVETTSDGFLDAVVRDVPTRLVATDTRLAIEVQAPVAFAGVATQLDVVTRPDAVIPSVTLAHPVRLDARHAFAGDALRLRVPGRYGLELAVPCASLALGRERSGEVTLDAEAGARWYDVDGEVAVRPEAGDAIVGWLGSDRANAACLVAFETSDDPSTTRARIFAPGLVVTGRVDRTRFTERGDAAVVPVPAPVASPPPASAQGVIDVPRGARVFASPTASEPWATTTASLVLVEAAREGERIGVVSIEEHPVCAGEPCPSADLRWVIARRHGSQGGPESTVASWFDASEIRRR